MGDRPPADGWRGLCATRVAAAFGCTAKSAFPLLLYVPTLSRNLWGRHHSIFQHAFVLHRNLLEGTMDADHVDKAIVENYRKLRTRMGIITLAFPIVVIAMGAFWGIGLQATLSDYYFAGYPSPDWRADPFPVRLWFCGILFAVGVFLFRYRGFSKNEDRWLSVAGFFALGVAIFPTSFEERYDWKVFERLGMPGLSLHGVCAVLAFLCIAVVIFWYSDSTLSQLEKSNPAAHKRLKAAYFLIGAFMAVAIGTSVLLHYLNKKEGSYILFAEWAGIWAFAAYWFVKNWEIKLVAEQLKKTLGTRSVKRTEADVVDNM
jgi:hypothetical protein